MPSLADSLAQLAQQSDQITVLSAQNDRPTGPFVAALLNSPSVLQLIRDAHDSETRLFKFIGEETHGGKMVEKRDGSIVTPLKDLKKGRQGGERDQVGTMLRTAMKLVDDYHPMPRARAHIQNLLEAHQKQAERVAELERLISEATAAAENPSYPTPSKPRGKPAITPEQAIQAEENALRKLDASLAPLRQASGGDPDVQPAPQPLRSPSPRPLPSQTPAKTPSSMPHISNSLVNGTTPRRPVQNTMNRFSPLKFLGTPRAPVGRSGLRDGTASGAGDDDDDDEERRSTIFGGLARKSSASYRQSMLTPARDALYEREGLPDADETIRLAAPLPPATPGSGQPDTDAQPVTPDKSVVSDAADVSTDITPKASPAKVSSSLAQSGSQQPYNVDLDTETVKAGAEKIWSTMSDMMRQGVKDGTTVGPDTESTVKHIYHLSQSDPPSPPSPSNASSLSSLSSTGPSGPKAPPITNQTILIAYLLLLLLQSQDGTVTVQDLKEALSTLARARGWEGGEGLATKVLYLAVGRRVVRIDRRGGGGGKVSFAL